MVAKDENQAGGKYKQTPVGGDSVFATVSLDGRTYQVIFAFVFFRRFFLLLSVFVLHVFVCHLCPVVVCFVFVFSLSEGDFFALNFYAERLLFENGRPYF